ncbi:hypothetical protein LTR53_016109, partial [Teratosphaeriaceae sp. CCFEE 6253]
GRAAPGRREGCAGATGDQQCALHGAAVQDRCLQCQAGSARPDHRVVDREPGRDGSRSSADQSLASGDERGGAHARPRHDAKGHRDPLRRARRPPHPLHAGPGAHRQAREPGAGARAAGRRSQHLAGRWCLPGLDPEVVAADHERAVDRDLCAQGQWVQRERNQGEPGAGARVRAGPGMDSL